MSENEPITNLEELLEWVQETIHDMDEVSYGTILRVAGQRSFGTLLLIAGLVTLAPIIGDIPGVPTIMGASVFLIAIQILFGRDHFWLPGWILRWSVEKKKVSKVVNWLRRPAKFIDRFLRQRLVALTRGMGIYVIAVACIIISVVMPTMEMIPFSANIAGAALVFFGLSLIASDGLLALFAFLFTAIIFGFVVYNFIL